MCVAWLRGIIIATACQLSPGFSSEMLHHGMAGGGRESEEGQFVEIFRDDNERQFRRTPKGDEKCFSDNFPYHGYEKKRLSTL